MEKFIQSTSIPSLFQNSGLNAFALDFASSHYTPELHAEFNIPLPDDLKNACLERKSEYLAGRYAARLTLDASEVPDDFILGRMPDRSPSWPEGITGSISHSHGKCFIIAGKKQKYQSVGIDAENLIARKHQIDKIESAISLPKERELMDRQALPTDRTLLIGILFTLKESLYKAIRPMTGQGLGFNDIAITDMSLDEGTATWQTQNDLGRDFLSGRQGVAQFEWDGTWLHAMVLIP